MLSPITNEELEIMEAFHDPTAMTETLFPEDYESPQLWPNGKTVTIRDYQFALQNYLYCIADDPKLEPEDNVRLKKGAGDLYTIGSRNTGKSYFLKIDIVLSYIHGIKKICLGSFDDFHLERIANPIADFLLEHKFLNIFKLKGSQKKSVQRKPLNAKSQHGCVIESANEEVKGNNPGEKFHGQHYDILYYEEYSYASDEGSKKRICSGNSLGHVFRPSGIPDLCLGSPLGKVLVNDDLKNWLWQLPQMVRPDWSDTVEQEKIEEFGGAQTVKYKLNVLAETIPGAFGFFDMQRIKDNSFKKNGVVKFFEVGKENFVDFPNIIHVERLAGCDQIYICGDLGFGAAPTELIIVFQEGKKFKYEYNISLQRLTPEEQPEIIFYLYKFLEGAYVALDSTSDSGAMIERLAKMGVPRDHLLAVDFASNIEVGFEKDVETGEMLFDNNNDPIMKKANSTQWSFSQLEKILYSGETDIPNDAKFETQFTNIICKKNKTGIPIFDAKGPDHLVQSWQVFSICKFFNEFNIFKRQYKSAKRAYYSFT